MHPSPPMPEEIKAGFYPDFEKGWRRAELVGRAVMLLVVGATLAGLLGGGPVSLWTRKAGAGPLQVEYSPVVRFGTPTGLTIRVATVPGQERIALVLPAEIVKRHGLQTVFPQPQEWVTGEGGGIRMLFPVQPGVRETVIQVGGMTTTAILGEDRSFSDGRSASGIAAMTGIFTVGLMHVLVSWLKLKSVLLERIIDGTPIVVFEERRWSPDQMRKLRMQEADIRTAMRQRGMIEMDDMRYAIIERNGTISIIPKEKK